MCGITGYVNLKENISPETIRLMTDSLAHRGPDGDGIYFSPDKHLAFGHRRLSFLDLSENGKQPMQDNSGQLILTFNGEIYNFQALKKELSDYEFKTKTDTEVILAGYKKWGIEVIHRLEGMFAFALFDAEKQLLFLVRDRFGIKPLYFSIQNEKLLFASELKAIHAPSILPRKIDFSAFADYFVYRYIPSPKTIWENIQKLPPAHYLEIDCQTLAHKMVEYWQLHSKNSKQNTKEFSGEVGKHLKNSVQQHSIADVPVGSFLSGGYDSSALVMYLKKLQQQPKTFSIGFSNWAKSEDYFAKLVAEKLNVENESVIADASSLDYVERMATVYDEPIADISIVPTYMVSQLARTKVKAVVSGEGADEIFGGYTWQHDFYRFNYPTSLKDRVKKFLSPKTSTVDFYAQAMAMGWFDREELKKMLQPSYHSFIPEDVHWFYRENFDAKLSPLKSIQKMDIKCFMGELVLTKIDRASMANSLEVRVPFLNHHLFEFIFEHDEKTYFKPQQTKFLLYENLKNDLPKEILNRKKQGFVGPDAYYMDLNWYKQQFENSQLVADGIVRREYIEQLLQETYNWKLWKLLIMEKWYAKWK